MWERKAIWFVNVVVLAICAVYATSAYAVSQWLVEGGGLAAARASESEGSFTIVKYVDADSLEILTVVRCEGIFVGFIGPTGSDSFADLLNLNRELITGLEEGSELALECTVTFDAGAVTDCEKSGPKARVWVDNLSLTLGRSWPTSITLSGGVYLDEIRSSNGEGVGFEVECVSLFLGVKGTELCLGNPPAATLTFDTTTVPDSVLSQLFEPEDGQAGFQDCTMTGEDSGALELELHTWAIGAEAEHLETSISDV
jgi:hypothetical protein